MLFEAARGFTGCEPAPAIGFEQIGYLGCITTVPGLVLLPLLGRLLHQRFSSELRAAQGYRQ
jgi:hypothetical protein